MLMPRYTETGSHSEKSFGTKHSHASTTVAAHTKMRLINKVEQHMRQQQNLIQNQNQSINKIIHTAATGNGLVGDVDDLLMPMRTKDQLSLAGSNGSLNSSLSDSGNGHGNGSTSSGSGGKESHSRPERNLWSRAEMIEMLNIMQQMNALDQLNDRNVKSEHVFRQIEEVMRSKGFVKKSSIQIWTKWKFLKSTYNTTTRHGNGIPKVVPEEVYRVLCRMLREHASANASGNGSVSGISSECGNSMDSSNAELIKPLVGNEEVKEPLGVEHPIFGFRLGLIKPEPVDTGYETILSQQSSSEQELETSDFVHIREQTQTQTQTLDHTPFMVNVKHEPEMDLGMDDTNTPPPTAPTSPSPPPPPTSLEHRALDNNTPISAMKTQSLSVPPLRVAAFANDAQRMAMTKPTHGILHIERPGAMQNGCQNAANGTSTRITRSMPLQSTSSISFVHPTSKLMLPRKQLPMKIPREISVQPAGVRPLKNVPVRDTGYSLRPDRMIPDLEQSISPPQSPSPPMHGQALPKYSHPSASTSKQAQLLSEQQEVIQQHPRKRRMQFNDSPVPIKLQRSSTLYENGKQNIELHAHDTSAGEELASKRMAGEAERRKQQQEEAFKKELAQLANAMRTAQKEMLQDFFQQQKQLARREHEFQLKQDHLVMSALRKQSDILLRTAKKLLQSEEEEEKPDEEEDVADCVLASTAQLHAAQQLQQKEEDDTLSTSMLLQPDIELQEDLQKLENEETKSEKKVDQYDGDIQQRQDNEEDDEEEEDEEEEGDEDEDEEEEAEGEEVEAHQCEVGNRSYDAAVTTSNEVSSSQSADSTDAQIC